MLDSLAGRNQAGVHRRLVEVLVHDGLPFFENAGDAVAVFALHLFAEPFHDLFEPLDVTARLFEVGFERIPENGG